MEYNEIQKERRRSFSILYKSVMEKQIVQKNQEEFHSTSLSLDGLDDPGD